MKLLIILTFIIGLSFNKLPACGADYGEFDTFIKKNSFDFLDSSLINMEEENHPLYKVASNSVFAYRERVEYYREKSETLNIQEWQTYFEDKLTKKEVRELFYGKEGTLLKRYKNVSSKLDNPTFTKYLTFLEYQTTFVQTHETNTDPINYLERCDLLLNEEKNEFLKLRYLFLMMRLTHYTKFYQDTLDTYKEFFPKLKTKDSIAIEWIDALRAGALQHLGKDVESNLLYGEIFKNNKTNAHLGYYDFKIKNDTEWKNLLSQTKTPDHKALFYFLRALKWDGVPLIEHRELAKIAPNSIWFERLTYMIMQTFQNDYMDSINIDKKDKYSKANHKTYLEKKNYFVKTLKKLKEPSFFSLYSQLYLNIKERKDLKLMPEQFKKLNLIANNKQKKFVEMLSYINGVRAIKSVEKEANKKLFSNLSRLLKETPKDKQGEVFGYTAYYMKMLYPEKSAEKFFSVYCASPQSYRDNYLYVAEGMDNLSAENFEKYVEKKERSIYENLVFKTIMNSLAKNDVAKFLAILHTKNGNFKKAKHYLEQVPELDSDTSFNPFNVSLSGNNRKIKGKGYSQRKFVDTMLNIYQSLEKNPTSAMDHYLYANGLYNSTWFGNFPMAGSIVRDVRSFSKVEALHMLEHFKTIKKEYNLALKYAQKNEFKAKIAYQMLKIDYNEALILADLKEHDYVYISRYSLRENLQKSKTLEKNIHNYQDNYAHTVYGKEIIKKCATFKYFR